MKNLPANAGDMGFIPGSRTSLGEENGNLPQYSYLRNRIDRAGWWATVLGVEKSQTQFSDLKYLKYFSEEIIGDVNYRDFLLLYDEMCQHLGELHNSVDQYFSNWTMCDITKFWVG